MNFCRILEKVLGPHLISTRCCWTFKGKTKKGKVQISDVWAPPGILSPLLLFPVALVPPVPMPSTCRPPAHAHDAGPPPLQRLVKEGIVPCLSLPLSLICSLPRFFPLSARAALSAPELAPPCLAVAWSLPAPIEADRMLRRYVLHLL